MLTKVLTRSPVSEVFWGVIDVHFLSGNSPPPTSLNGHGGRHRLAENLGELKYCSEDPLNFSESGWWGRIFSEMRTLIPILIGLFECAFNWSR